MSRRWKLKAIDEQIVRETAECAGLPIPLARALALRGHRAPDEIEDFLDPRLAGLSDPFLLPDMPEAVSRIWKAIDAGETITVFGDYDVDGVTAAALLTRVLAALGAPVKPFIPDRLDEGYGLSLEALGRCLEEHDPALVITVDCGTNSADSIAHAQVQGIDVIVTDHHEPEGQPTAFALINPKLVQRQCLSDGLSEYRPRFSRHSSGATADPSSAGNGSRTSSTDEDDVNRQFKADSVLGSLPELENLSGVGIAFKLAHALLKVGREAGRGVAENVDLRDYLDLAALGTVADIVPLTGENRIIVRHGLAALDATKWEGLRALKAASGMRGKADTYHLGFQLGPRINAAGRIGQPMQALRLLTTEDPAEAREIANLLNRTNLERRKLERDMADEAFAEIDAYFNPEKNFGLVVAHEGWHPGVVGIVASRVSRHYNRPAIVMGIDKEGNARGSCRSIDEFDVLEGLRACDQHLIKYGGHKMAAGVELSVEALKAFKSAFNAIASSRLEALDLAPVQHIDAEVLGDNLDWKFFEQLKRLHPFGQDNPEPVWAMHGIELPGKPRVVGQNHLKLSVASGGRKLEAIAFNYPLEQLPDGRLDIAFTLKENNWNGNTGLQLQIKDIRPATSGQLKNQTKEEKC
ncbi:MAG: DHH family phosphoesterase [Verrucomicrobiota bacterium]